MANAMYAEFYGLQSRPFNQTPDPRFLHLTRGHREALAQLTYGVQERKGFIVLTGEVGTGKTTLIQALLARLGPETSVALLFDSTLSFDELFELMLGELGLPSDGSRVSGLRTLRKFVAARHAEGGNVALILDEAQNLDAATLERVRLLSNLETPDEKLLQIVMVGQPELGAKLDLAELRQLRQRVGLYHTIEPLDAAETGDYIHRRLAVAGAPEGELFSERAVRHIAEFTRGVPRVINTVGDHCLLFGYVERRRQIDRDIVRRVVDYLERRRRPARRGMLRWLGGGRGLASAPEAVAPR